MDSSPAQSPARGFAMARAGANYATGKAAEGASHFLLSTLRMLVQLGISFAVSVFLYSAIYRSLVPSVEFSYPLHFGVCQPSETSARVAHVTLRDPALSHDHATESKENPYYRAHRAHSALEDTVANRDAATPPDSTPPAIGPQFRAGQYYTADICFDLPESPANVNAGTFLVSLDFLGSSGRSLVHSTRPLALRYRSDLVRWMQTWVFALPLLFGWMEERQQQCIQLAPRFYNSRSTPFEALRVLLSACELHVYHAELRLHTQLGTLSSLMNRWFMTSATMGVGMLMALVWLTMFLLDVRRAARGEQEEHTHTD